MGSDLQSSFFRKQGKIQRVQGFRHGHLVGSLLSLPLPLPRCAASPRLLTCTTHILNPSAVVSALSYSGLFFSLFEFRIDFSLLRANFSSITSTLLCIIFPKTHKGLRREIRSVFFYKLVFTFLLQII